MLLLKLNTLDRFKGKASPPDCQNISLNPHSSNFSTVEFHHAHLTHSWYLGMDQLCEIFF